MSTNDNETAVNEEFEEMPDYSAFLEGSDDDFEGPYEDNYEPDFDEESFLDDDDISENDESPEFHVLWNTDTDFYYITEEGRFYIFSDTDIVLPEKRCCVIKSITGSLESLLTELYNHGFSDGYLDNKIITIKKNDLLYWNRNPNRLYYQKYAFSKDDKWLSKIHKDKLWALCKITKANEALFAIVTDSDTNESYLLAFTDKRAIPNEIKERYPDFTAIKNPLLGEPFLINFETTLKNTGKE